MSNKPKIIFDVLTIFPEMFPSYFGGSILGKAQEAGYIKINVHNLRDFAQGLPAPRPGTYFVYAILCDNEDIYIGQTGNLELRWRRHIEGTAAQHTKKHKPKQLIHYEIYDSREKAVEREKWLKTGFGRKWLKKEWKAGRTRQAGKHKITDDMAYGGISGMVMKVEPIYYAVEALKKKVRTRKRRIILLSAKGELLKQKKVRELGELKHIILIAGHYKGVDERVAKYIADEELSVGEYVITGGEVPAMLVVDAVSRMVSGVIGKDESKKGESFSSGVKYEHGVYTRPAEFSPKKGKIWKVPDVLLSGHHKEIASWRDANRETTSIKKRGRHGG